MLWASPGGSVEPLVGFLGLAWLSPASVGSAGPGRLEGPIMTPEEVPKAKPRLPCFQGERLLLYNGVGAADEAVAWVGRR